MGTMYLHAVASLDGYIADERDEVGPLHDWYFNGDHPLVDEDHAEVHGAPFRVSAASSDYVGGLWSRQRVLVVGRHQFDLTNGWEGHPPASDHVVVVSHRPKPTGWHRRRSYHFAASVEEGMARAQELAGEGEIGVGAGEVGGQALSLGLIDYGDRHRAGRLRPREAVLRHARQRPPDARRSRGGHPRRRGAPPALPRASRTLDVTSDLPGALS